VNRSSVPNKHLICEMTDEVSSGKIPRRFISTLLGIRFRFHELCWDHNGENHLIGLFCRRKIHFDECRKIALKGIFSESLGLAFTVASFKIDSTSSCVIYDV